MLQGTAPTEDMAPAVGTVPAEGTLLAEAPHPHSLQVAQGMVELNPVVRILFPSSESFTGYEKCVLLFL